MKHRLVPASHVVDIGEPTHRIVYTDYVRLVIITGRTKHSISWTDVNGESGSDPIDTVKVEEL